MDKSLLPNIFDFISHTYPFCLLNPIECDAIAASIKISYHTTAEELKDENLTGIGLFMIRCGAVKQINNDGSLRAQLGVGDSFGYTQMGKSGKSDYKVIFLENTLLYTVSRHVLQLMMNKSAKIAAYFDSKEWVRLSSSHSYSDDERAVGLLSQKVGEVCLTDPTAVSPDTSIIDTAKIIKDQHALSAVIMDQNQIAGIVTKSDLAMKALAEGLDPKLPVKRIMTANPVCIEAENSLLKALNLLIERNIEHLPVIKQGKLYGLLTTAQLMQRSQLQPLYMMKDIARQTEIKALHRLSAQTKEVFATLIETNVKPRTIQAVMSKIADAFAARALELALKVCGPAPYAFAFFAAGSLARSEIQFLSDQDNGMVLSREPSKQEREYFHRLSLLTNEYLAQCGYKLCDGNFMASNEKWCQSADTWIKYYDEWINCADAKALLDIQVFLDLRCLYGDEFLVAKLKQHLMQIADNQRFLALLTACALQTRPPLGMFRQFVLTRDGGNKSAFNIKKHGVNPVVEMARIYALASRSPAVNTCDRLEQAHQAGILTTADYRELIEAYSFINHVRFSHQLSSLQQGAALSNDLSPKSLSQFERNHLKDAFSIIAKQQNGMSFRFAGRGI